MSKFRFSTWKTKSTHSVYVGDKLLSPFHDFYANDKTILRLAANRYFAHYNGEDIESSYWALRKRAALFDVPERPLEILGRDATEFLNHVLTRRSDLLKIGSGHYTLACTHEGGIFIDGILFRLEKDRFWFVQPDGELDAWLLAHSPNFDVSISDPQSRVLQIQGPLSFDIINAATKGSVDNKMGYFKSGFHLIGGQKVYISRTGWSGELGYEIYTLGQKTDCRRLWSDLWDSGQPRGMIFSSMQAMNIRRIEAGIFDSGSDFDTSVGPADVGLSKFVDMDKDYFIGRQALLNRRRRQTILGVLCNGYIPKAGDLVYFGSRRVGFITTGAYSPKFESGIGYARLDIDQSYLDCKLKVLSQDGSTYPCDSVQLPFYDRNKLKPRTVNTQNPTMRALKLKTDEKGGQ